MKSTRLHDALRRTSFDTADRRGNNPHGTREQAEAEGRRLNGFRYETVAQAERSLDHRSTVGEAPLPVQPKSSGGGGGGSGLFWLLAAGAGIALLSALSSDDGPEDADDDDADDELAPAPSPSLPLRENPSPTTAAPHITVNLTMPQAPATTLVSNPAPMMSEPVHVTVPVMAPVITAPLDLPPPVVANPLPEVVKKRRKKTA
jgi:hypothetical protein